MMRFQQAPPVWLFRSVLTVGTFVAVFLLVGAIEEGNLLLSLARGAIAYYVLAGWLVFELTR